MQKLYRNINRKWKHSYKLLLAGNHKLHEISQTRKAIKWKSESSNILYKVYDSIYICDSCCTVHKNCHFQLDKYSPIRVGFLLCYSILFAQQVHKISQKLTKTAIESRIYQSAWKSKCTLYTRLPSETIRCNLQCSFSFCQPFLLFSNRFLCRANSYAFFVCVRIYSATTPKMMHITMRWPSRKSFTCKSSVLLWLCCIQYTPFFYIKFNVKQPKEMNKRWSKLNSTPRKIIREHFCRSNSYTIYKSTDLYLIFFSSFSWIEAMASGESRREWAGKKSHRDTRDCFHHNCSPAPFVSPHPPTLRSRSPHLVRKQKSRKNTNSLIRLQPGEDKRDYLFQQVKFSPYH